MDVFVRLTLSVIAGAIIGKGVREFQVQQKSFLDTQMRVLRQMEELRLLQEKVSRLEAGTQ